MDVKLKNTTYAINVFYRPPIESKSSHEHFFDTAENILRQLDDYNSAQYKVIASDFNFGNCYCKNPTLSPKSLDFEAPDLFESYGFKQIIDIPFLHVLD